MVGVGVRAAAARAGCGVRAAWAGVEGCSLSLARSLALSLSLSLPGLSGMVHVSDVHHWTKSVGSTPPLPPLECSVFSHELPMCVRWHMRMGMCVRARIRRCVNRAFRNAGSSMDEVCRVNPP